MRTLNKYRTTLKRWLASMIDGLIFLPLSFAATYFGRSDFNIFLLLTSLYVVSFMLYLVIGHGKYGQTLGKSVIGIKVLNKSETGTIGYTKAFLRESVWFFAQVTSIAIAFYYSKQTIHAGSATVSFQTVQLISSGWLFLEVVTMLLNKKRRAIHDLIAGSVVVNLDVVKAEKLRRQQEELIRSLGPAR